MAWLHGHLPKEVGLDTGVVKSSTINQTVVSLFRKPWLAMPAGKKMVKSEFSKFTSMENDAQYEKHVLFGLNQIYY